MNRKYILKDMCKLALFVSSVIISLHVQNGKHFNLTENFKN